MLVGQWDGCVVNSDASFAICSRVEKGSLDKHVTLLSHETSSLWLVSRLCFSFYLVHNYSVLVDDGTQDQIICLLLNELVTVSAHLIEPKRSSDSEDGFPGAGTRQTIVQLVRELEPRLIVLVLRVIIQIATREFRQVTHRRQVLVHTLAYCEDKEIDADLRVCHIRSLICPEHVT